MNLHDFLVEHAKFPFPDLDELQTADATDISDFETGLLERQWKARHAVRDETLVQKLCHSLENILGDLPLVPGSEDYLLQCFLPLLQVDRRGIEDDQWAENQSEAQSKALLEKGFFEAARKCFGSFVFGPYRFKTEKERCVVGGSSKVDYVVLVNKEPKVLCEAKSPSVMKKVRELLPSHGIKLTWIRGQSLVQKILSNVALFLGLRKMEWLSLTCHNHWIVCRLVRDNDHPYLAYSSEISIKDSSEPFRAFLGAILSVFNDVEVPVGPSAYSSDMELDTIEDLLPEDDIDNDFRSRAYDEHEYTESGLFVTSSSLNSPEDSQVWIHLYSMSNNTLALPQCARNSKQRLWLTRFISSGSTGNVWECHFDNSDDLFAVKVVEMLRLSDADRRQRLRNEFNVYLTLDKAYQSGQLRDRIAPRCYGAYKGNNVDVLIIDLCHGILSDWKELSAAERSQLYKLVQDLHSIGIVHGDLEPRNIGRARGGGFFLIDFSESKRHVCNESKGSEPTAPTRHKKCLELQTLRNYLWKRQRLVDRVNVG